MATTKQTTTTSENTAAAAAGAGSGSAAGESDSQPITILIESLVTTGITNRNPSSSLQHRHQQHQQILTITIPNKSDIQTTHDLKQLISTELYESRLNPRQFILLVGDKKLEDCHFHADSPITAGSGPGLSSIIDCGTSSMIPKSAQLYDGMKLKLVPIIESGLLLNSHTTTTAKPSTSSTIAANNLPSSIFLNPFQLNPTTAAAAAAMATNTNQFPYSTDDDSTTVLTALNSLSQTQITEFLTGQSPLNLTMRLDEHVMLIQLQLNRKKVGDQADGELVRRSDNVLTALGEAGAGLGNSSTSSKTKTAAETTSSTLALSSSSNNAEEIKQTLIDTVAETNSSMTSSELQSSTGQPVLEAGSALGTLCNANSSFDCPDMTSAVTAETCESNSLTLAQPTLPLSQTTPSTSKLRSSPSPPARQIPATSATSAMNSSNDPLPSPTNLLASDLTKASRDLTESLKQLSKNIMKLNSTCTADEKVTAMATATNEGDCDNNGGPSTSTSTPLSKNELLQKYRKGIYSGTFSGPLNPQLQNPAKNGNPYEHISTIVHILNDLLKTIDSTNLQQSSNLPKTTTKAVNKRPAPAGEAEPDQEGEESPEPKQAKLTNTIPTVDELNEELRLKLNEIKAKLLLLKEQKKMKKSTEKNENENPAV